MSSLSTDNDLFERIVQEVIRRLVARGVDVGAEAGNQLVIPERLITLTSLEGKLDGVATLHVKKRTVVTPAVKDELRRRRIKLVVDER